MDERDPLARLLGVPGDDSGCDGGAVLLAEYVEAELAGRDAIALFPTVAVHLRNCPACAEDYRGLVALVRGQRA
jgi:hypothetical protein